MSSPNYLLHESLNQAIAVVPNNYTGAATTDQYFSLKQYQSITFTIVTGAYAGGTPAVTLLQAQDVSGTGSKALTNNFATVFTKTLANDVPVAVTVNSGTFNLDTANKLWEINVKSSDLDIANGFCTIACHIATPGGNADYYVVLANLNLPRFSASAPPSALLT